MPEHPLSLDDARELLSTFAALGETVPAPTGTTVYLAALTNGRRSPLPDEVITVGVYSSSDAAWHAMARSMLTHYEFPVSPAEYADGFDEAAWSAGASPEQILAAFGVHGIVTPSTVRSDTPALPAPRSSRKPGLSAA